MLLVDIFQSPSLTAFRVQCKAYLLNWFQMIVGKVFLMGWSRHGRRLFVLYTVGCLRRWLFMLQNYWMNHNFSFCDNFWRYQFSTSSCSLRPVLFFPHCHWNLFLSRWGGRHAVPCKAPINDFPWTVGGADSNAVTFILSLITLGFRFETDVPEIKVLDWELNL